MWWAGTPGPPGRRHPARVRSFAALASGATTALIVLSACDSGDSTVAKTPGPTATASPSRVAALPPPAATPTAAPPTPSAPPPDPCAIDNAAPAIIRAVSDLPKDPRSGQSWNPEPLAGNYNQCAQLSAVIIKANTNAPNPNTRAVLFHLGNFIPTGVPDTFGFNDIDADTSTGDTVALRYSNGVPGLDSIVKFHWNGNGVEVIGGG